MAVYDGLSSLYNQEMEQQHCAAFLSPVDKKVLVLLLVSVLDQNADGRSFSAFPLFANTGLPILLRHDQKARLHVSNQAQDHQRLLQVRRRLPGRLAPDVRQRSDLQRGGLVGLRGRERHAAGAWAALGEVHCQSHLSLSASPSPVRRMSFLTNPFIYLAP
jgi:hypothetical protein